ncbi:MAG TPA: GAF domain-containing protein, partial [Ktedonobacteraceae bacterium]|nr:GAF domain-containing protein [Ktedonobacteraceae bacterium]
MSVEQPAPSNVQEHQRLLAALRESEILRELAELLTSSLDLNHILQVLVKRTTEVCQIERCAVWLLDETDSSLRPATYYLSSQQLSNNTIKAADHIWKHSSLSSTDPAIQRLFKENGMLFLEDLTSVPGMQNVAETFLVRSILIFALVREGRPVGMLTLDEPGKTRTFSTEQMQLARAISQQAAMAIDNARLLQQAHEAAKLATERANTLDAIFHAMTEGISVIDLEGNILMRNNAAASFLGKNRFIKDQLNEVLNLHPTYTVQGQLISGEDFPVTRSLRGERIRGERFVTTRADGNERILEVNIAPLFDAANKQIGVVSAFRDVTEQIRVEQRIRQALDTLLHVAEAVTGITEIKDILHSVLERALVTLNCAHGVVQLYDEEHQCFTPLLSIGFSPETEQQWFEDQQVWLHTLSDQNHLFKEQLFQGHATLINAEQCLHQPNPFDHLMILSAPILHHNRLHGIISLDRSEYPRQYSTHKTHEQRQTPQNEFTLWDIAVTEGIAQLAGLAVDQALWQQEAINARASEAAMREANALKDEFLAITAHEFRTPLTVILAQSQLVTRTLKRISDQAQQAGITKLPQVIDNLSVIADQTHQLTNIVSTFLEVTRLNRGELTLHFEEVDLSLLVQNVASRYKALSKEHSFSCIIGPIDHSYLVKGDNARLKQIIANLVENAIKYSPQGGSIKVYLRRTADIHDHAMVEVCIEDKGIGIPKDAQPRLFERFYRAPNT